MILLDKKDYHKLRSVLRTITFNHLFATAVVDQIVEGRIYVDNTHNPRTFYIAHKYGMSLLGGDQNNHAFNNSLIEYSLNVNRDRAHHEWMQVFPLEWSLFLQKLFSQHLIRSKDNNEHRTQGVIELNTRVNFVFDKLRYLALRNQFDITDPHLKVVNSTPYIYDLMDGSVVPRSFWDSAEDFRSVGSAFSLYADGKLAATAFSSFLSPGQLELGIETLAGFRRQHVAEKVCAALIDHCIEHNLEPIWACRLENTGSYNLAKKLGFIPVLELPYYRLSN
jgi:hypothetical protein